MSLGEQQDGGFRRRRAQAEPGVHRRWLHRGRRPRNHCASLPRGRLNGLTGQNLAAESVVHRQYGGCGLLSFQSLKPGWLTPNPVTLGMIESADFHDLIAF
jgi:hypothetical protein